MSQRGHLASVPDEPDGEITGNDAIQDPGDQQPPADTHRQQPSSSGGGGGRRSRKPRLASFTVAKSRFGLTYLDMVLWAAGPVTAAAGVFAGRHLVIAGIGFAVAQAINWWRLYHIGVLVKALFVVALVVAVAAINNPPLGNGIADTAANAAKAGWELVFDQDEPPPPAPRPAAEPTP